MATLLPYRYQVTVSTTCQRIATRCKRCTIADQKQHIRAGITILPFALTSPPRCASATASCFSSCRFLAQPLPRRRSRPGMSPAKSSRPRSAAWPKRRERSRCWSTRNCKPGNRCCARLRVRRVFLAPISKRYDFTVQVPVKSGNEIRYYLVMGFTSSPSFREGRMSRG